jgi:hypothetical protein
MAAILLVIVAAESVCADTARQIAEPQGWSPAFWANPNRNRTRSCPN